MKTKTKMHLQIENVNKTDLPLRATTTLCNGEQMFLFSKK